MKKLVVVNAALSPVWCLLVKNGLKSALLLGCMFLRQFRLFPLIVVFKSVDLVGDALVGVLEQGFLARKVRLGPFPFQDVEQIVLSRQAEQASQGVGSPKE